MPSTMAIGCACMQRAGIRTMRAGRNQHIAQPRTEKYGSKQPSHGLYHEFLQCAKIPLAPRVSAPPLAGSNVQPILQRPATLGRKGADDGIPDGLLQPISVARRLRCGRDWTGVCATGDSRRASRDSRAADDHRGVDRPARARSAAGADLDGPGPSAAIGPPACGGPRRFVRLKNQKPGVLPGFVVSAGPADRNRTCISRLGGACTIHCATASDRPPGDAKGRPSEPRFYAICGTKTRELRGRSSHAQPIPAPYETMMTPWFL